MDRRKDRTQAILRDILRSRRGWECPTATHHDGPWHDVFRGEEPEIDFRMAEPSRRGPARRLAYWLFMKGGMSVVLIVGLIAFGLVAGMLERH